VQILRAFAEKERTKFGYFGLRIKQGYEDAKEQHQHLIARGLRPLPNAPLTPWPEAQ
jgi:hypothetical protein